MVTTCFQVISMKPSSKVLPYSMDLRQFLMPIQVQVFNIWQGAALRPGEPPPERLDVFTEGTPTVMDAFAIGPWLDISQHMQVWGNLRASTTLDGAYTLSAPRLAHDRPDWGPQCRDYPAFLMMRALRRLGWRVEQDREAPHTPGQNAKTFSIKGLLVRKSYLRCLLTIDTLFEKGLESLYCRQHELYYTAILRLEDKQSIQPGLLVRDYNALLEGGGVKLEQLDEPVPMEPLELPAALEFELGLAGDEWGDDAPHHVGGDGGHGGDGDLPPAPPPAPPPPPAPGGGRSSDSSASSSRDGDSGSDGGGEVEIGAAPRFKRIRDDLPTHVEGVAISEQIFNEENDPQRHARYHKLTVDCPLSSCQHSGLRACTKSRVLGEAQTRNFGRLEVIGYLGRWLQRASEFASRDLHMAYRPTTAEIETYLQEAGLL